MQWRFKPNFTTAGPQVFETTVQLGNASPCDWQPCDLTRVCNDTFWISSGGLRGYTCSAADSEAAGSVLPAPLFGITFDSVVGTPTYFFVAAELGAHTGIGVFSSALASPSSSVSGNLFAPTDLAAADADVASSLPLFGGGSGALTVSAWVLVTATSSAGVLDCASVAAPSTAMKFSFASNRLVVELDTPSANIAALTIDPIRSQEWHLITFTSNSTLLSIYVDHEAVALDVSSNIYTAPVIIDKDPTMQCSIGTNIGMNNIKETLLVDVLWLWNDVALSEQQIARLYQWPVVWSASPQHVALGTSVVTLSGANLAYNPLTGAAVPPLSMLLSGAGSSGADVPLCTLQSGVLSVTQYECLLSSDARAVLQPLLSLQQPSLSYAVRFSRAGIVPGNSNGSSALLLSTSVQLSSASPCEWQPCDLTSECSDGQSGYVPVSNGTQYTCSAPGDGTLVLPAPAWSLTFDNPAAPPSSYFTVVAGAGAHSGVGEFSVNIQSPNAVSPNMYTSDDLANADAGTTSLPPYGGGNGALTVSAWFLVTATSSAYILDARMHHNRIFSSACTTIS